MNKTPRLQLGVFLSNNRSGRPIKTAISLFPIVGETAAAAHKHGQHLQDGAHTDTMANIAAYFSKGDRASDQQRLQKLDRDVSYSGRMVHGNRQQSPTLLKMESSAATSTFFDDFISGLNVFHAEVMPLLKRTGLLSAN